ncbi:MAG: IS1182 family transposase [Oscillospiraceae bacterium]|nr:IS1182 family transposase [Oscillospiraceae bacterium]
MLTLNTLLPDYTAYRGFYQIKLPIEMETMIPADDPVRLLSAFVEGMDLSELYATYDRVRKNQASPRQMLKIMIYASMNRLYSSREIETACRRDINFMYLLEGMPVPDHATVARFISLHLSACSKDLLARVSTLLFELGEISAKTVFIDGTKIESCANRYTFVWKKSVTKHQAQLLGKIVSFIEECETLYGIRAVYNGRATLHTLKRLRKKLYQIKEEEGISFVYGIGHRKTQLQRSIETLEGYIDKLKEYIKHLQVCGNRNSYSKTDPDATFMRLKEDAMLNGQLKPAYNLQHGVDAQYITWLDLNSHANDVHTLVPFMKDMEAHLPFKYREVVADAGYESEEAYVFLEQNGQESYLKPQNYEISRTRKYRQDISRRENMAYDEEKDEYICTNGRRLRPLYDRHTKSKNGYISTVTVYECEHCHGCTYKEDCIHGNNCKTPMEERNKQLNVSKVMKQKRQETLERITTEYGAQLRMNRSIQAEGSFAVIKEDMNFRRYLYRGRENVLAQSVLLAIAYNINKLHFKIQGGRCGQYLTDLKTA